MGLVTQVLDQESKRMRTDGEGPMGEIDFWRDRNAALSAIYEQLRHAEPRQSWRRAAPRALVPSRPIN